MNQDNLWSEAGGLDENSLILLLLCHESFFCNLMRFFFKYCDLNYTHMYIVKNAAHKSKSKSSLILFIVFTSVSQPVKFLHRKYPVCLISKFRITFLSKCLRKPKQSRKIQRKCFPPLFNRQSCAALNMKKKKMSGPLLVCFSSQRRLCATL